MPNLVTTQLVLVTTLGIPGPAQGGNERKAATTAEGKPFQEGSAAQLQGQGHGELQARVMLGLQGPSQVCGVESRLLRRRLSVISGIDHTRFRKLGPALGKGAG